MSIHTINTRFRRVSDAVDDPNPFKKRRILPENATSSRSRLFNDNQELVDLAVDKACRRVIGHFTDAVLQETLKCRLKRGNTEFQGGKGTQGNHACHYSTQGSLLDDTFDRVKENIVEKGVSSPGTTAYLKAKRISTPLRSRLHSEHQNPQQVEKLLKENISPKKRVSVLRGTHYGLERNATLEQPSESNGVDCRLEKLIRPFEKELEERRAKGEISPEDSTALLVEKLDEFYQSAIEGNALRIRDLKLFFERDEAIEAFHAKYTHTTPSDADFTQYFAAIKELLELKKSLLTSISGTYSCKEIKSARRDFGLFKRLVKQGPDLRFYLDEIKPYLQKVNVSNRDLLIQRYERYEQEAISQRKGIASFKQAEVIDSLRKRVFGIGEQGVRRAPTEQELSDQIYELIRIKD